MKKIFLFLIIASALIFNSCSNDSNPTGTTGGLGGGNGGGGGGGAVTITISQQNGTQGIVFLGSPSAAVVVTKITVTLPEQQFEDVLNFDGTTVVNANEAAPIGEYTGVQPGQKWVFVFTGKLGSATGQAFTVTSNYTVK